jgi:N-acetylmuramic acid 6-phosphate etherase
LRAGSRKLEDRAVRIVAAAAQLPRGEAARLLAEAGSEVKTAIVMARADLSAEAARARLAAAGGHVRLAITGRPAPC